MPSTISGSRGSWPGNYPGTVEALDGGLAIYRELGHRPGQASALHNLGSVRWRTDNLPAAAEALERALKLHRGLDDQAGQAGDLAEEIEALADAG